MKKISFALCLLFIFIMPAMLIADLIEDEEGYRERWFIAPAVKMSQINDELGTMLGLRIGWITAKSFTVEGSFYGLINEVDAPRAGSNIGLGYSGVALEYSIPLGQRVNILINTMLGIGRVSYKRDYSEPKNPAKDKLRSIIAIVEPGLGLEIGITNYMRITLGAGYSVIDRVDLNNLTNKDISGISGNIALKFGDF